MAISLGPALVVDQDPGLINPDVVGVQLVDVEVVDGLGLSGRGNADDVDIRSLGSTSRSPCRRSPGTEPSPGKPTFTDQAVWVGKSLLP